MFLNYCLTFPVEYPNDVKAKILASFRRGLQRSLPESLIYDERFTEFSVDELASEPAAFAVVAGLISTAVCTFNFTLWYVAIVKRLLTAGGGQPFRRNAELRFLSAYCAGCHPDRHLAGLAGGYVRDNGRPGACLFFWSVRC